MENIHLVYPEIFISLSIMLILMIGVFKTKSSNLVYSLSIIVLFVSTGLIINSNNERAELVCRGFKFSKNVILPF